MEILGIAIEIYSILASGGVIAVALRWVRSRLQAMEAKNKEDRQEVQTLKGAMQVMQEKIEDQSALIAHFKHENTLLITQQTEATREHKERIDRLIEVEKKLTEVTVSLDRTEAQLAGERVQKVTLEDKVIAMRKDLTEAEREMFRFQGYKQAVKEVFDTFKVKLDYTPPDPLNGDDKPDPTPSGPGGGGGKDDEKTIPITNAVGKPIPEDKAA